MNNKRSILFSILLIAGLLLTACQAQETATVATEPEAGASEPEAAATTAPAKKEIIAVSLPALDNPLMLGFQDAFKGAFGADYDVQVASADGNPNNQATQVENFTAMGTKLMFVMPVESTSLVPKLIDARNAGILALVAGGDPGDPECL